MNSITDQETPFKLKGKRILVTGASSGIGRSISIECSRLGASVTLTSRDKRKLAETQSAMFSGEHTIIPADLSLLDELKDFAAKLGKFDGIVLNAGFGKNMPVRYLKEDMVTKLFDVNIKSSILLINSLLKESKINKGASICFISSVSANLAQFGNSVYGATKGAVNSFARALAYELAPQNIKVNAILPGYVETNFMNESGITSDQLENHRKSFPLGRFGRPEDIAYLTVYLLSDASAWMTGSLITIDGGYSLK